MASIYDYMTGDQITVGLQGASVCDEAIQAAKEIAAERNQPVVLDDDDGVFYVTATEVRPLTRQECIDGGWGYKDDDA